MIVLLGAALAAGVVHDRPTATLSLPGSDNAEPRPAEVYRRDGEWDGAWALLSQPVHRLTAAFAQPGPTTLYVEHGALVANLVRRIDVVRLGGGGVALAPAWVHPRWPAHPPPAPEPRPWTLPAAVPVLPVTVAAVPPVVDAPPASLEGTVILGALDRSLVHRVLEVRLPDLGVCGDVVTGRPATATHALRLWIGPSGDLIRAEDLGGAGLTGPAVHCLLRTAGRLVFPATKGGGLVRVDATFGFGQKLLERDQ